MSERPPPDDDPIVRRFPGVYSLPSRGGAGAGPPTPGRPLALLAGGVLLFFLLSAALPFATRRITDWLWYRELGFERVFLTKIAAQWAIGLAAGAVAFAALYASARTALRGVDVGTESLALQLDRAARFPGAITTLRARLAATLALPGTIVLALLVGVTAAAQWRTALQFAYRTPFGVRDPVFGRDVGYYVFSLPAISAAIEIAWGIALLSLLAVTLPIYLARGDVARGVSRIIVRPAAQVHFAALAALLLVLEALRVHFVGVPALLHGEHTSLSGANYTDLHARLPALRVLTAAAVLGAGLIVWGALRGQVVRMALVAVAAYLGLSVMAAVLAGGFQRLVVQPNELAREAPQIVHHIRATRQAWRIDSVARRELSTDTRLTPELIAQNRPTIDNVRLWDREPLLQTFGQIQSIRTYYDFVAVDDDRYRIGSELRQVMLSARELNSASLPTRGFINEHLTYTHGMGVTLGPTNQVTAEGLPVLFVKDLPPVSNTPSVRITRPQIYFGELSNDFVLAPSRQPEFDYPAGEGDEAAYSAYDGRGGVPVASFARRLLFALRFGSLNILLSRDITDRTRILYHRDIRERAERSLPFLTFDRDPYVVITDDGRLRWMLDAYTTTSRYPYARADERGVNYMRNSVKVVIDAYDGDVRAYLADPGDPIIRTLARIYPGLLQPLDAMPADLRAHIRYPEDLFRLQTSLYATYHMGDPATFYHREDQWQIPAPAEESANRRRESAAFLRHMVMRLPGEREPEFILMRPFTPRQKDNLAAWMVARNDGAHYGELVAYRFPRQSLVFGPNQIVNRINQDTEVSRQISLWDQRGSEVLRGELLVIPIEGALLYVQPLYLRAQGGRIPELKRVVVAHEGRVTMEETLDAALGRLFSTGGLLATAPADGDEPAALAAGAEGAAPAPDRTPAPLASDTTPAALVRRANDHFERARAAQRADDWATYGEEMRKLGEVLRGLRPPP